MQGPSRFLVALSCVLLWTGCGKETERTAEAKNDKPAVTAPKEDNLVTLGADAPELAQMSIESVKEIPVPADAVTAPAKIEANPNRVGRAVLPAPGQITRVLVKLGDSVTQGQPLVMLNSEIVTDAETAYVQAENNIRQAELAAAKADADLVRVTDLFQHQAVAQKEVLAAQTASSLTKAALEQSKTSKDQARRRLELLGLKGGEFQQQIVVRAPMAGKVLEVNVAEGEFRNEINVPLITVSDLSHVWATSDVPESLIRHCRVGGSADLELIAYPKEIFRARVTRIADTVNSDTRTIKVSAELENPNGRLRPEMFGELRYAGGTTLAPWVPNGAVVRIEGHDYVFREVDAGKFRAIPIQLGEAHKDGFAVLQGLAPGDRVVTKGALYLKAAL
jgi:cobalt-zinc-cadmium efflux system membrane fusion protein